MDDFIKRINLSFDLRREQDRQVYEILSSKQHKTTYVIDLILSSENSVNSILDKNSLKECLKEVLEEMSLYSNSSPTIVQDNIPKEIFDIFEQI